MITGTLQDPFQIVDVYVMAREDFTEVTLRDENGNQNATRTIAEGESTVFVDINVDYTITSSAPVQVDVIAGDRGERYEIRWYAIAPISDWSTEYWSPVGVSPIGGDDRQARVWCFNPGPGDITCTAEYSGGSTVELLVPEGEAERFPSSVPNDSGVKVGADQVFFAFMQVDSEESTDSDGLAWDWGHPLIPVEQLTSQAIVGLGIGCPELLLASFPDCTSTRGLTESKQLFRDL